VNPEGYPFFQQMWDNLGQSLSLGVSIPIYTNLQNRSRIDKARIGVITTKLNEQNTRNFLRKTIEQAYSDLRASVRKYEATRAQLDAVESVYKNAEVKYSVGAMSATDFLIEKKSFAQTQSGLIQARYNTIFLKKILDFYQGKAITF
jgi:outer membrane protein